MLFDKGNPYIIEKPPLVITSDDYVCGISSINLEAIGNIAEWTTVAYMAADCNLSGYMFQDLIEMKEAGSDDKLNICVFFHGPLRSDSFFARLNRETSLRDDIILRFADTKVTKLNILANTIKNYNLMYPAKKKILFLSGHGNGWRGVLNDEGLYSSYKKSGLVRHAPGNIEDCARKLNICNELVQKKVNQEIDKRLNGKNQEDIDAKIKIIALDACYMGNIETILQLSSQCRIIIASENSMPGEGYAYDNILKILKENPDLNAMDFARSLITEYGKYYGDNLNRENKIITQIALDCAKITEFSNFIELWSKEMISFIAQNGIEEVKKAVNITYKFTTPNDKYIDIIGLVRNISSGDVSENIKDISHSLVNYFYNSGLVLASNMSANHTDPTGLSIYFPPSNEFDMNYLYIQPKEFPNLSIWPLFLATYYITESPESMKTPLIKEIQTWMIRTLGK